MRFLLGILSFCFSFVSYGQYSAHGTATGIASISSCTTKDCYRITANTAGQAGSVWSNKTVDLSKPFDGSFCVYLGNANTSLTCFNDLEDNGADGMALVFKSLTAPNTGIAGSGLGLSGITPSVGFELDTYPSGVAFGDSISSDHTALVVNGLIANPLIGPIPLNVGGANAENGNYHVVRITWNPTTFLMEMYFNGVLRISFNQDIVSTVFSNNPIVQVGAVGSTGGCYNLQTICFPLLQINLPDQELCVNDSTEVTYYDPSLISYLWTSPLGDTLRYWDSTFATSLVDTSIFVKTRGDYVLRVVSYQDTLYDTVNVNLFPLPIVNLGNDTTLCQDSALLLDAQNPTASFLWSTTATTQSIAIVDSNQYWVEVTDTNGCVGYDTIAVQIQKGFSIFSADNVKGCVPLFVRFANSSYVINGSITSYLWEFDNGKTSKNLNDTSTFNTPGRYSPKLTIVSNYGCVFDTTLTNYIEVFPYAIADFSISPFIGKENAQISFNNKSQNSTSWDWDFGNGKTSTLNNPTTVYNTSGKYDIKLVAKNQGGCNDSIWIEYDVIKSPTFFAPSSFTPNDDGVNDTWNIVGIESAEVYDLKIYNRWGELVFATKDKTQSWEAKHLGENVQDGIYVYRAIIKFGKDSYEQFGHINVLR